MTRQEFIEEIMRLPVAERIALLEAISRSLREEFEAADAASHIPAPDTADERERRLNAVRRLRGIAKPDDGPPPSDEEVREIITNHLIEKYS